MAEKGIRINEDLLMPNNQKFQIPGGLDSHQEDSTESLTHHTDTDLEPSQPKLKLSSFKNK